ncbi:MAG: DUF4260 domain-containing protein [Acetobacteraceae bacterium]|nr:DUF4260 domain-containing protein [Acetobacteraceae bacterium]
MSDAVTGILRAEGAAALVVSATVYHALGGGWMVFAVLFLAPDLSMMGYLANPRLGAVCYNAGHSYLGPAFLGLIGWLAGGEVWWSLALIWSAHIGFDRLLGYGLKFPSAFGATHLGWKGRRAER